MPWSLDRGGDSAPTIRPMQVAPKQERDPCQEKKKQLLDVPLCVLLSSDQDIFILHHIILKCRCDSNSFGPNNVEIKIDNPKSISYQLNWLTNWSPCCCVNQHIITKFVKKNNLYTPPASPLKKTAQCSFLGAQIQVCTVEELASCADIQYILKAFNRKRLIESIQSKAFSWKRSIESVQSKAFNKKRSIESVQVWSKAFDRKRSIDIGCPHNWQFLPLWYGRNKIVISLRSCVITK